MNSQQPQQEPKKADTKRLTRDKKDRQMAELIDQIIKKKLKAKEK